MPTELFEASKISQAAMTGAVWRVKVIEGNKKGSSAYYPADVVEAGAPLFKKGTRVYGDHPTSDEKWSRPERSYRHIVGVFESDSEFDGTDLYANVKFYSQDREFIKERAEDGVIGMSIRASGDVEETADGPVLKAFTSVTSVDVVTTAGAGGGFDKLLESEREISAAESVAESHKEKESIMDPKLAEALDALVESAKQNTAAIGKLTERAEKEDADKATAVAEASRVAEEAGKASKPSASDIAGKLLEADLPKAAHARVLALIESGAEVEATITAEKEYLKTVVAESGKTFAGNGAEEIVEAAGSKIGASMYGPVGD
jgi:hypothetical protein